MDLDRLRSQMTQSAAAIESLVTGVSDPHSAWKPAPESWSMREVVGHLWQEERDDFRVRVRLTLESPEADWPALDPVRAVAEAGHQDRSLDNLIAKFLDERAQSLEWLGSLKNPAWDRAHPHPRFGPITAGTLLASWVGHDLLHLRQLARLRWQILEAEAAPHILKYAGDW